MDSRLRGNDKKPRHTPRAMMAGLTTLRNQGNRPTANRTGNAHKKQSRPEPLSGTGLDAATEKI